MTKVLRILNRFNVGGPIFNASYLTKYMPSQYESKLIGGINDESEANSLYVPESLGLEPIQLANMKRKVGLLDDRKAYLDIKKIIKEFKPDIVHTHASKAGAIGRFAASNCKVPIIIHTFHGNVFDGYFSPAKTKIFKSIERYLAEKSTAIVCISNGQKEQICNEHQICPPEKVHVIPLGLDLDRFSENEEFKRYAYRTKFEIAEDTIAIGIIGRLVPVKNHSLFIQAISYVKNHTQKKVQAFIIGDGEERRSIEDLCRIMGLKYSKRPNPKADVIFTSWILDVEEPIAGLDLVCLTSINEGTPVSLIEAQAGGRAVVATKAGSTEEVVKHNETGLICDVFQDNQFYLNLLELIDNDELRKKFEKNGKAHVQKNYSIKRLVEDTDRLYQSLLDSTK